MEKKGWWVCIYDCKFEKSSKDLDQLLASQITDKSKKGFGYNAVPSPHPLILNRPTPLDLSYSGLQEFKQPEVNEYGPRDSSVMPTTGCDKESDNSKENTDDSLKTTQTKGLILALWEDEHKKVERNNDAPIIEDWVSDDEDDVEPILCCPIVHKHMVPRRSLNEDWLKTVNNARPVNTVRSVNTARPFSTARSFNTVRPSYTAHPKSTVHCARPRTYFQNQAPSTVHKPFYKKIALTKRTGRQNVNTVRARGSNAVKPQQCWVWKTHQPNGAINEQFSANDKGKFFGCGILKAMSGNISPSLDFKDFDGGYVTFGGGANGVKVQTSLVSHRCLVTIKNYVIFTSILECLVLSPNFKLPDENQILLKIPRQDNMYSFDMKNIVPKDGLTCLMANKGLLRNQLLGLEGLVLVKFKKVLINLSRKNLVEIALKRFEDMTQTCVACLNTASNHEPLVRPRPLIPLLSHCLCCIWISLVQLLSKDETSEILKNFIKEVENLVDKKVKIIRSDNGTEFKNKVMDEFCREKGIKREYSVARTPQQNGVAERKNRTLIEAARTMLADSKLPTTFWAEVVSTACYVQKNKKVSQALRVPAWVEKACWRREVKITATIDGHSMTITEGSLRRHLKLDDQDGISSIPNSEIFEQLALMGYHTDSDKLTFQKGAFSPQWRFLIHSILHCLSPKEDAQRRLLGSSLVVILPLLLSLESVEQYEEAFKGFFRDKKLALSTTLDDWVLEDDLKKQNNLQFSILQAPYSGSEARVIQDVTPTEVIQDQQSSEKGSAKVSTAGAKQVETERLKVSKKMKSPEKSPEKIEEEDVDTQEEMKEVVKETGAKRKKSIPRKSTRKRQKLEEDAEKE
ncbi:putative ribonuclease H-like domain-containing protein [Tanacetum coccineum]